MGGADEGKRHQHGLSGVTRRPPAADPIADLYSLLTLSRTLDRAAKKLDGVAQQGLLFVECGLRLG
jgi:hypothetical protein